MSFVTHTSPHLVLHGLIDPVDQPGEGLSIDSFGQGISGVDGMVNCEWAEDLYSETKSYLNFKHYMESLNRNTNLSQIKPKDVLTCMHLICFGFNLPVCQSLLESVSIYS